MTADTVIYGKIAGKTDRSPGKQDFIAFRDGRILAAGEGEPSDELTDGNTKIINLGDSYISPGFTDGHAHISFKAKSLCDSLDLHGAAKRGGYEKILKEYAEQNPGKKFIFGQGFNVTDFGEKGPVSRMLDDIFGDIPVIIESDGCHDNWVSTAVLKMAGIDRDTPDPRYGEIVRDSEGHPTGFLREEASELIDGCFPPVSVECYKKAIIIMQEKFLCEGITYVYEPIVLRNWEETEKAAKAYHELDVEGMLKIRVRAGITLNPSEEIDAFIKKFLKLREETRGEHFGILGVKLFMDGVVEGRTAFLREDYSDKKGFRSEPLWKQEYLNEVCLKLQKLSVPVHVHSMGDAATDMILEALSYAKEALKMSDEETGELRNAITHLQVISPDQYKKIAELRIVGVANTFWHFIDHSYYWTCDLPFLGKERAEIEYPVRSLLSEGVILSQASDWPVTDPNTPLSGMEIAVTRCSPGHPDEIPMGKREAIDIRTAYDIITKNGAYQLKLEKNCGSLEEGKYADLVILGGDPLNTDAGHIHEIKIKSVYISGEEVYTSSSSSVQST